jgi:hypothetical protein
VKYFIGRLCDVLTVCDGRGDNYVHKAKPMAVKELFVPGLDLNIRIFGLACHV